MDLMNERKRKLGSRDIVQIDSKIPGIKKDRNHCGEK